MRSAFSLLLLTVFAMGLLAASAQSGEAEYRAVVVDSDGNETELTELRASQGFRARYALKIARRRRFIVVEKEKLEVAIPFDRLIEATFAGETAQEPIPGLKEEDMPENPFMRVEYLWNGKRTTIEGPLSLGWLRGKSDFGQFELLTTAVRRLTMSEPPSPPVGEEDENPEHRIRSVIALADGSEISASRVMAYDTRRATGYIGPAPRVGTNFDKIGFQRGDATISVGFSDIARVEFGEGEAVTITLKNGKTATGELSSVQDYVKGFCGVCEYGHFYVAREHVKTIDFVGNGKGTGDGHAEEREGAG